jgi:hypothetical protein
MRIRLLVALSAATLGVVAIKHTLDASGYAHRPPADQPFHPSTRLVTSTAIGGIRIGEALGDVESDVGTPTVQNAAVPHYSGPVEVEAIYHDAGVFYDQATRRVTAVDAAFSTGIRTPAGDHDGTRMETVRQHYPGAVHFRSTCARNSDNLLLRAAPDGYVLDFYFIRQRLVGAMLISWSRFTEACWILHHHRTASPLGGEIG